MNSMQSDETPTDVPNENLESVTIDDSPVVVQEQVVENDLSPVIEKTESPTMNVNSVAENQRKQQRVIQDYSINAKEQLDSGDHVTLPSNFDNETQKRFQNTARVNLLDNPQSREWAETVTEGMAFTTFQEVFTSTLEDEEAEFRQKVEINNIPLMGQAPKFKPAENENLKGERAIIRLISHLGLGTLFQTPLWHSGLWVTFKPPTDTEIVELNRQLTSDKIKFGRYSYGLAYSNTTVYTIDRIIEFALAHIYDVTVLTDATNGIPLEQLRSHISCQDIPSLIWGFVCTMYPRGFKYSRACVENPERCNFILHETLNLTKLQWVNTKSLSEWQKTFMSGRQQKSKNHNEVKRYKEELTRLQNKRITLFEGTEREVSITLSTPSIASYIDAGHRWIGDIVETVDRALQMDAHDNERNALIIRHGQASALRQYTHWIHSIEYQTNIIDDRETIESLLSLFSADNDLMNSIIKEVVDYINGSTIAVIGIPVFDCPQCKTTQESPLVTDDYKNIIPLDMVQLFFDLVGQRLTRMSDR